MTDMHERETAGDLSPWWRYGALITVLVGFGVAFWIAGNTYRIAPPIPDKVVDSTGAVLFTGADIMAGQQVFLKHALMEHGTLWGHGAYMGPDFSAEYLHRLAMDAAGELSQRDYGKPIEALTASQRQALDGQVRVLLVTHRYDSRNGTLLFTQPEAVSYRAQIERWRSYFAAAHGSSGLPAGTVSDPGEIRQLTSFFAWAAWASAARIPGKNYSYTNNFPYDPDVGNGPSSDAVIWSALSLVALLAGTAAILFAFGRFDYLGWKGKSAHIHPDLLPGGAGPSQRAVLKYFVVVVVLFLGQTLTGGALAHFRAQPEGFYGFDLSAILPGNLLRTWHLQLGIFWIATAYVAGGLFLASALGRREPRGQVGLINVLFVALAAIVFGSLAGEMLGMKQLMGKAWFWFGHQGWEYLELGRGWQCLLVVGLLLWTALLIRAVRPALKDPEQREISTLFLISAFTIPLFYLPAFFFGRDTHFTVVDTWRFWIIHLWVEGFFELFATVMVAVMFFKLDMVSRKTATRVIYLDAILFLGSGIIGTGHHWYWTGQTSFSMAISATFSAMEVVPLVLLSLDASAFMRLMKAECAICGKRIDLPHKWTFYFLIAVGVWNFIGAGVFGFLINMPIVSYYEAGTNLTANHGHAALMGVFGFLAVALLVFALRQASTDERWKQVQKFIKVSFWGLNIGLALMVVLNLFPTGVLQFRDVVENGYWHARSEAFLGSPLMQTFAWLRMPADMIFILFGVAPLLIATLLAYKDAGKVSPSRDEATA